MRVSHAQFAVQYYGYHPLNDARSRHLKGGISRGGGGACLCMWWLTSPHVGHDNVRPTLKDRCCGLYNTVSCQILISCAIYFSRLHQIFPTNILRNKTLFTEHKGRCGWIVSPHVGHGNGGVDVTSLRLH